ncbi:hypothetical protein FKP32DRAFT_1568932 [Trametes sanguinea]|nr:hypothetical protein FKP32DRAFT_1568932 [Trametes sanguinea]
MANTDAQSTVSAVVNQLLNGLTPTTPYLPLWVKNDLYESRIKPLLDFSTGQNKCSLSRVPRTARWGEGQLQSILCINNSPVKICVVGELQTLIAAIDMPKDMATTTVRLELFTDGDKANFDAALNLSQNVNVQIPYHFECARVDRRRKRFFAGAYDGTDGANHSTNLRPISLQELSAGDIVQVETIFVREDRSTRADGNQQRLWWKYSTRFALVQITLVARRPSDAHD